jgi:hypothetical protein
MASVDERRVLARIARLDAHHFVPAVRDRREMRINGAPHAFDHIGQRVGEILVLAAPETVALHHDAAAEHAVAIVETGERFAFVARQESRRGGAAIAVQLRFEIGPVERADAFFDVGCRRAFEHFHVISPDRRELICSVRRARTSRTPGLALQFSAPSRFR